MKLSRSLLVALFGALLFTGTHAQTEADVAALLTKAQRGNSIAQYRLGLAYSNGHGVAPDPIEAYVWLSLAYEGGFRGKALGNVAGGLDLTQLETARARLTERRSNLNVRPAPATASKAVANDADTNIPVLRTSPAPTQSTPTAVPVPNPKVAEELATAVADKQQLSTELSQSWSETEALKKQLTDTQAAADFLTAETSKLHAERDSLTTKLEESAKELAALRTDRDHARSLGVQAEAALTQANTQKIALETSLHSTTESAITDKKWLSDELTKSFQEVTTLKAQLAETSKNAAATPATPVYPNLSGKVKELEASLVTLTASAHSAKQEAATLRQAAATPATPAYPDLREQVATLHNQLAVIKTQTNEASQKIAALTQAKDAAEKSATPAYPDLSGKLKETEAALTAVSAEAKSAKQEASRLADDRIEREKQLLTVQQQAAEAAKALTSLQQEAETLRKVVATPAAAPAYPDLREQVAALNSQLADQKAQANEARQQIAALTQTKAEAEKLATKKSSTPAYPDLSAKVKDLEASLTAVSSEAKSAKQEASRLADDRIEREKQLLTVQQQNSELANAHAALQQDAEKLRQAAAHPVAPAYPDLREQVALLTGQLAVLKTEATQSSQQIATLTLAKTAAETSAAAQPTLPAYPDLSSKVRDLETTLAAQTALAEKAQAALLAQSSAPAQTTTPAYPDLSGKVQELEASLVARVTDVASAGRMADELRQAKTETEQKLAAAEQARTELTQQFDEFKRSALAIQREHLNQKAQVQMLESEKTARRQQTTADQTRLADLSAQLAASRRQLAETYPTTPAHPDQRARVEQLEAELNKTNEQANSMVTLLNQSQQDAKSASDQTKQLRTTIHELEIKVAKHPTTPAYPDLREQVSNLESQLAAAQAQPKSAVSETQLSELQQELTNTREKLATTMQDYVALEKERDALAKRPAPATVPDYSDQRARVAQLETELNKTNELSTTSSGLLSRSQQETKTATEQAEQLRSNVHELEAKVAAAQAVKPAPTYPDLREQMSNLEIQLEAARALPKFVVSESQFTTMKQDLADTKTKLATTLRGYALIEKERDALAAKSTQTVNTSVEVARMTEAYGALQRSSAQTERDLATTRAQLQQALSANNALAQATPAPKSVPAPEPVAVRPLTKPTAPSAPGFTTLAPVTAPAPVATGRIHVIVAGDSLTKISQRYYGTPNNWQPIYNANKEKFGPNGALRVGTELRIP